LKQKTTVAGFHSEIGIQFLCALIVGGVTKRPYRSSGTPTPWKHSWCNRSGHPSSAWSNVLLSFRVGFIEKKTHRTTNSFTALFHRCRLV